MTAPILTARADASAVVPPADLSRPLREYRADSQWGDRWKYLAASPGLIVAGLVIVLVLIAAFLPAVFTRLDPLEGIPADHLLPPSGEYWFGTDNLGRDLYTRVVHGSSLSLLATTTAVLIACILGSTIGLIAGYFGGVVDDVLMRAIDVLLAIPGLLLSLAVVTALGFGTINVAVAVGVASVPSFARVMRAEVFRIRHSLYIEAATASGVRWHSVLLRQVLPNATGPVVALAALEFGMAVLAVSALSFLGYGAAPPLPEWGSLVAEGRNFLATGWWLTTFPGVVVVAVVLSANRISRALDGERTATR